jgi:hypothetical protein
VIAVPPDGVVDHPVNVSPVRFGVAGAVVICAPVVEVIVVAGAAFCPSKVIVSGLAFHWALNVTLLDATVYVAPAA